MMIIFVAPSEYNVSRTCLVCRNIFSTGIDPRGGILSNTAHLENSIVMVAKAKEGIFLAMAPVFV